MDITPYREIRTAPQALFLTLPERAAKPRFMLPTPDGDWRVVTWKGFARQVRNAGMFLVSMGLRPEDRAAIFGPNRVEWASSLLAIQAAGGVMVPIYSANTTEQAAYVARHSDARVLFVDTDPLLERVFSAWSEYEAVEKMVLLDDNLEPAALLSKLRQKGVLSPTLAEVEERMIPWSKALAMGEAWDKDHPGEFEKRLNEVSLEQPGLMLYTSGTSGNPKGVPLTHLNVGMNGLDWLTCNHPLIDEAAVDLCWLPMSHIFGLGEVCLGNTLGFTTYMCDPMSVARFLPEVRPSVFMSVPAFWEKIAMAAMGEPTREKRREKIAAITGGRLRFCLSGGAGLKQQVKEFLYEAGMLIIEGYGLTETSPTLTLNRPDAFRFDTVGKPLPSVALKLAEDGEILAKGPNVFRGYHKDPEATKEVFTEDGWLKTGDIGRFTEDGFLQIVDRKKDILVTAGGKNVPPANIEMQFRDDPFISQVLVYGDGKHYLVAGVWVNEDAVKAHLKETSVAESEWQQATRALVQKRIDEVNAKLAKYETIKKFAIISQLLTVANGLLTPTLKMKRKKVCEMFKDQFEALYQV